QDDWKRVHTGRLVLWLLVWGGGIVATGHLLLGQPLFFLLFAIVASLWEALAPRRNAGGDELPPDMSATSLAGGGLIAGDALAALLLGLLGLLALAV
ncbi:MAG: peptide transporter, partial [Ramlibacter sp.]|nr:peptide transporter [Ramlibacter sp.]